MILGRSVSRILPVGILEARAPQRGPRGKVQGLLVAQSLFLASLPLWRREFFATVVYSFCFIDEDPRAVRPVLEHCVRVRRPGWPLSIHFVPTSLTIAWSCTSTRAECRDLSVTLCIRTPANFGAAYVLPKRCLKGHGLCGRACG